MNTNGQSKSGEPNIAASFSGLAHDVIELAELQAQLFTLDIKSTSEKTRTSLVLAVAGACALLGSVPVALFALGELFQKFLGISEAAGFGLAALVGVVLSAVLMMAAWSNFKSGEASMRRSREELSRNLAWVKSNLRGRAHNPADHN